MNFNRNHLVIVLGVLFVLAAGYIVYEGRPVMKLQNQQAVTSTSQNVNPTSPSATTTTPVATTTPTTPTEKPVVTTTTPTPTTTVPTAPTPTKPKGVYSMADVQAHATATDCWTTINGGVYDLTTWVSRHPGGENPIKGLCGTDGSAKFNRKHGSTKNAQSALILLKIGTLE